KSDISKSTFILSNLQLPPSHSLFPYTTLFRSRIVITRAGKPSAVLVGIESYDEEDLRLASSPEFWRLIEERRTGGTSVPLSELKDRKSTRLNSSHRTISYAVFCLNTQSPRCLA